MKNSGDWSVADLCDDYSNEISVVNGQFKSYGGKFKAFGRIETVVLNTDNSKLIELLSSDGKGKIAFVTSPNKHAALVGDRLASIAIENNWEAIIVDGAVRDIRTTAEMDVCLYANSVYPVRGARNGGGEVNISTELYGVIINPRDYVYVDNDGVIVSQRALI